MQPPHARPCPQALGLVIINCVCVTIAASLPSPRVILVCQTVVVRPRCSGVHSALATSPSGMPAQKLVLLSIVAGEPPLGGRFAVAAVPPRLSAKAITAPPCITPLR